MKKTMPNLMVCGACLLLPYQLGYAQEKIVLPVVNVHAGKTIESATLITQQDIAQTPKAGASIDYLLRTHSAIRFTAGERSSERLGEIAPANLSVHGEAFYNNQFALDGLSNSAQLNPAHNGTSPTPDALTINNHTPNALPAGHAQAFWVSNELLDKVEVKDSNISARHGRFTGGYIAAQLRQPDLEKSSGQIGYRHSRDAWTHFYIDNAYEADFNLAQSPETQPKFVKHQFHANLNQPLGENAAILLAYEREQADIPIYHQQLKQKHIQQRLAQTLYLKGKYRLNGDNTLSAGVLYSPHSATYFPENIKEGRYRDIGGGFRLEGNWQHFNRFAEVNTQMAYSYIHETMAYDKQNLYRYIGNTPSIDWVSFADTEEATTGGLGTTTTARETVTLKQSWEFEPIVRGELQHNLAAGWSYNHSVASVERDKASRIYAGSAPTSFTDCTDCIPGEQYFTWYAHIHPVSVKIPTSYAALWAENRLIWRNLSLTLGLRADYNQFLRNLDFSPRSSLRYDFGDSGYYLSAGANRYYGAEMLTYKLQGAFKDQDNYQRRFEGDSHAAWEGKPHYFLGFADSQLNTPYSDELTLALGQQKEQFAWEAKWVRRLGREQFLTKRYEDAQGRVVRELTNEGRHQHDTLSVSISTPSAWKIGNSDLSVKAGVDYQHHSTNQQIQTFRGERWWESYNVKQMLVDGVFYSPENMPVLTEFHRPWGGFITTRLTVPDWQFSWEQRLRYEAPRKFYSQNNIGCPNAKGTYHALCAGYTGGNLSRFDSVVYNPAFLTDWQFSWTKPVKNGQMSVNLDVLNVFNQKIVGKKIFTEEWEEKKRDVSYQAGRQFWLGLKYQW